MTDLVANILLVDDDSTFLHAMDAVLEGPGRKIFKAQSGEDALRHLLEHDFVLIVLDVRMPGMDGFEIAELIRQRDRSRYIPIIFISGTESMGKDVMQGMACGAVDYIFKPFTPEQLRSRVSVFVDLFHLHERLKQQAIQSIEETVNGFSMRIFTIRPGLLFFPITGLLDKQRFDHLKEGLLKQIKTSGAKVVVIDVTAASIEVDVMKDVKRFVEAAQQMGVRIIFAGSNTSVSNAKFVTDIKGNEVFIHDDLQIGLREAERIVTS